MRTLKIINTFWYHNYLSFKPHFLGFFIYHGYTPVVYLIMFGLYGTQLYQDTATLSPQLFVFSAFFCFAALIGAFTNMIYDFYWSLERGQFHSLCATTARLPELFLGRCLWSASRTMFTAIFTLIIGILLFDIHLSWHVLFISLFIVFLCNLAMTMIAMLFVAYFIYHHHSCDTARIIEASMVACSGVFIPMSLLPNWLENLAHIFPLYHAIAITRALWAGTSILPLLPSFVLLLCLSLIGFIFATNKLRHRIIT